MHKLETDLKLRPVDYESVSDIAYLFGVLALRLTEPDSNISHKALPSWDTHVSHLRSGIYHGHYLATISEVDLCLGCCYVDKHRNIGVYVQRGFRQHGIGRWMLGELIGRHPPPLTANINPRNKASLGLFRNIGFSVSDSSNPFQLTLRLEAITETVKAP